ncbi:MAG: hypothetical protein RIG68_00010 [Imperialibacter sp.]|uniref:hypothetical protein n=1 Tax=Imperialibacter sp. TaxID=2038411 RepID=UPI0032EB3AB3
MRPNQALGLQKVVRCVSTFSILLCLADSSWAQFPSKFDSLRNLARTTKSPVTKAEAYLSMAEEIRDANINMMPAFIDWAFHISRQNRYDRGIAKSPF